MFHQHLLQRDLGDVAIVVSYICFLLSYILMVVDGYRFKTVSAPLIAICTQFGIAFLVGFVGPWVEPQLFPPADKTFIIWLWRFVALLWFIIFIQYLLYGRWHLRGNDGERPQYFYSIAVGSLVVWTVTAWLYILFARDYYVNETYPLATVIMSLAFFATPILRSSLVGLSVWVAWLLAIATTLLYLAIIFGGMAVSYPCHSLDCIPPGTTGSAGADQACEACYQASGYHFMYWIYGLTVVALFAYAVILTKRRDELKPA